jgi:folate-dependent phosphoribosylglycinamide formyltransferase PurN
MEGACLEIHSPRSDSRKIIKTVFCTSGGILGAVVLKALVSDPDFHVVGLVLSNRVFRPEFGFFKGALTFFRRCGVLYTVYIWLITSASECIGKVLRSENTSVGTLARKHKMRQLITRDLNSFEGRQFLELCSPDLIITAHFDQKLDFDLCDGHNHAAVNLHPSFLPLHRGVEPVVQSLMSDSDETGISLHRLSEQIDKGRILRRKRIQKVADESAFALSCSLMEQGAQLLISCKDSLMDRASGTKQEEGGSYESWPTPQDILCLYRKGEALIRIRDIPRLFGLH